MINPPKIDSHAHVWDRSCTIVEGARYRPDYEATVGTYLRILDTNGIEQGVLVQPSFLGTDNRYLLDCLKAHPDRLRGIVMLKPDVQTDQIAELVAQGVIGVRYNLLSLAPSQLAGPEYRALTKEIADAGLWIEVQAHGVDWPDVLETLGDVPLMVDHFGKPSGPDCVGLRAILQRNPAKSCVKLSAPYRQVPEQMAPFACSLLDHFGAERCLWGSDWPWTQHEAQHDYSDSMRWLEGWTNEAERKQMRSAAPDLLGFNR